MLKRIITAIVGLSLLSVVYIFSDTVVLPIAFGVMAILGIYEMLGCIGLRRSVVVSICMYATTAVSITLAWVLERHSIFLCYYAGCLFVTLTVLFILSLFSKGKVPIDKACIAFATCSYIITGFASMVLLRRVTHGEYIFVLALLAPWVSDAFAYFGGRFFGKHKLIPSVSPKKTVEGSISGVVMCTIACFLFGLFMEDVMGKTYPVWAFAVMGVLIAVASQVGDLIFSLIKRRYEIKDYGFIFPGHGGILDRFDSVIATAPFVLMACELFIMLHIIG